jgi:hypothetical protein
VDRGIAKLIKLKDMTAKSKKYPHFKPELAKKLDASNEWMTEEK